MDRYQDRRDEPPSGGDPDQLAIERYRYLLRTAPPDQLERAHEEAFASLTPAQRQMVLEALSNEVEPAETRGMTDDPRDLARLATRTELRQPGTIERVFGGTGSMGGRMGGSPAFGGFLPTLAGAFMGTAIASMLFGGLGWGGVGGADAAALDGGAEGEGIASGGAGEAGEFGGEEGGRSSGGEWGSESGAPGIDPGDAGVDSGFGDAGGFGDLGGGDFGGFDI